MKSYYSINENDLIDNYYQLNIIENFEIFKGPKGNKGDRGYTGPRGLQGLDGERGYKGMLGDTGDRGPDGYQGLEGEKGIQGKKGIKGDIGPRGFEGARGDKGEFGPEGPVGYDGPKGFPGSDGRDGFQGPQGIKGPSGDTLDTSVTLGGDTAGVSGLYMHGFYNNGDSSNLYTSSFGNFKDPRNGGSSIPAYRLNYEMRKEAQCQYNGYLAGLKYYTLDANRDKIYWDRDVKDKITNTNHLNHRLNNGLPYRYEVDCKVVNNDLL
jgi:hypothetical protein